MVLAPAHVTIAMRESVGLPGVAGLLVRAVAEGGPAAAAGLRTGDVLLAAGGRELRSVDALYAAAERPLRLRVLRGGEERDVDITPAGPFGRAASTGPAPRGEHTV